MKQVIRLISLIILTLSFSACGHEDPERMIWEFSDYDPDGLNAVYSPTQGPEVCLYAMSDYSGDITLHCLNYSVAGINNLPSGNMWTPLAGGIGITRIDDSTLKISISPMESFDVDDSYFSIRIRGVEGKHSTTSEIFIKRILNQNR